MSQYSGLLRSIALLHMLLRYEITYIDTFITDRLDPESVQLEKDLLFRKWYSLN